MNGGRLTLRIVLPLLAVLFAAGLLRVGLEASREAASAMALGLRPYDIGAVLFFLGFAVGQWPAGWVIEKLGLQKAMLAALSVGGLLAAAGAIASTREVYWLFRLLLGLVLAPAAPAALLCLAGLNGERRWGGAMASTMAAWPLALAAAPGLRRLLGAPFLGLEPWRWPVFAIGLAVAAGAAAAWRLWDGGLRPAAVLTQAEASAVAAAMDEDGRRFPRASLIGRPLIDMRAWLWTVAAFSLGVTSLSLGMLLPGVGRGPSGLGGGTALWLSAAPWLAMALGMIASGLSSDRLGGRYWHVGSFSIFAAICLSLANFPTIEQTGRLAFVTVAAFGVGGAMGSFWPIVFRRLLAAARGAGIAMAMAGGALGMAAAGPLIAWTRLSGALAMPSYLMANLMLLAAATMLCAASFDYRLDFQTRPAKSRR